MSSKKYFLLSIGLLALSALACNLPVAGDAVTPEVLVVTATMEETATPGDVTVTPSPTQADLQATDTPVLDQPAATFTATPTPTATLIPQPQGPASLEELKTVIRGAIGGAGGSINDLPPALADEFSTCGYMAGCGLVTGQDRINFIVNQIPIGKDIVIDPAAMQPPLNMTYDPNSSFLSKGWVDNGQGEAVLFYVVENGTYKWSGGVWVTKPFAVIDYEFAVTDVLNQVVQAVMGRNWSAMQKLAPSDLKLLSIGGSYFPDQYNGPNSALAQTYLPNSANPQVMNTSINKNGPDYSAEIGKNVYNCCGVNVVAAAKMSGWGPNAAGQAIIVIFESGPDVFRWYGFYYDSDGF